MIIIFLNENTIEVVDEQPGISDNELVLTQTDTFGNLGSVAGTFGGAY